MHVETCITMMYRNVTCKLGVLKFMVDRGLSHIRCTGKGELEVRKVR